LKVRAQFSGGSVELCAVELQAKSSESEQYCEKMRLERTFSKQTKVALTVALITTILGSSLAYASAQKVFKSEQEFEVVDPSEPIIETSVQGGFINTNLPISVNMSAHEGVKQLQGTYTVTVELYNDTSGAYQPFSTLAKDKAITLTPQPTAIHFQFTTDTPGYYKLSVEFRTAQVVKG